MNDQFDELTMGLAQSVTRRGALQKFCHGLAGIVVASLGLANKAEAGPCKGPGQRCHDNVDCCSRVCMHETTGSVPYNKRGHCQ